jgi:small subunit ribosomal protein S9
MVTQQFNGTGRRKTSTARVFVRRGTGQITVNKRPFEQYFPIRSLRLLALAPLDVVGMLDKFDVLVTVQGGGSTGQAGAVRLGLARALVAYDESSEEGEGGQGGGATGGAMGFRKELSTRGYLTRDARKVERKKIGRPKARKDKQFSKR